MRKVPQVRRLHIHINFASWDMVREKACTGINSRIYPTCVLSGNRSERRDIKNISTHTHGSAMGPTTDLQQFRVARVGLGDQLKFGDPNVVVQKWY